VQWGLTFQNLTKTQRIDSVSYCHLGGLVALFWGLSPSKQPHGDRTTNSLRCAVHLLGASHMNVHGSMFFIDDAVPLETCRTTDVVNNWCRQYWAQLISSILSATDVINTDRFYVVNTERFLHNWCRQYWALFAQLMSLILSAFTRTKCFCRQYWALFAQLMSSILSAFTRTKCFFHSVSEQSWIIHLVLHILKGFCYANQTYHVSPTT